MNDYIYAVRDKNTGVLRSDLVNPHRKFWMQKKKAYAAIGLYCNRWPRPARPEQFEVVTFRLTEEV